MKKQILFIRGGESFQSQEDFYEYLRKVELDPHKQQKNWRDWIIWALSDNYDMITPVMPSKQNSDYQAWKIWFERHLEFIHDENPILIGHSLGGTFLLKYLSENGFPKKISQLHFVAPFVVDDLGLEKLATFEFDISKISNIEKLSSNIHIWFSEDDDVVPFKNGELVKENLPNAAFHVFNNRKHFSQPAFPEILQVIQEN